MSGHPELVSGSILIYPYEDSRFCVNNKNCYNNSVMEFIRGHEKAFKIVVVIALVGLIISSFLPFMVYLFQ